MTSPNRGGYADYDDPDFDSEWFDDEAYDRALEGGYEEEPAPPAAPTREPRHATHGGGGSAPRVSHRRPPAGMSPVVAAVIVGLLVLGALLAFGRPVLGEMGRRFGVAFAVIVGGVPPQQLPAERRRHVDVEPSASPVGQATEEASPAAPSPPAAASPSAAPVAADASAAGPGQAPAGPAEGPEAGPGGPGAEGPGQPEQPGPAQGPGASLQPAEPGGIAAQPPAPTPTRPWQTPPARQPVGRATPGPALAPSAAAPTRGPAGSPQGRLEVRGARPKPGSSRPPVAATPAPRGPLVVALPPATPTPAPTPRMVVTPPPAPPGAPRASLAFPQNVLAPTAEHVESLWAFSSAVRGAPGRIVVEGQTGYGRFAPGLAARRAHAVAALLRRNNPGAAYTIEVTVNRKPLAGAAGRRVDVWFVPAR